MRGQTLTIVMATLNGEAHLSEQLASIARQRVPWRLFVSDDGSTDRTLAILAEFARRWPVTVVRGPKAGSAAANFASALCHPDLPAGPVALADQDDVWLPGRLDRAIGLLADQTGPALYASESVLTDAQLRPWKVSSAGSLNPGFGNAMCQNLFGGHTLVMNQAALALIRSAGLPDDIAFHDWWLYQLVAGAGGQLVLDPIPTALYRQHDGNSLGGDASLAGKLRRLAMVLSGRWGRAMHLHAHALSRCRRYLRPEAQAGLDAYLAAPAFGPGRPLALLRAGLRRSSRTGTALMMSAACFGLL
jgi:glycosyltransferase involved in cell wall biosynthesis